MRTVGCLYIAAGSQASLCGCVFSAIECWQLSQGCVLFYAKLWCWHRFMHVALPRCCGAAFKKASCKPSRLCDMRVEAACADDAGLMVSGPQDITMKTLFEAGDYPGNRPCLDESSNVCTCNMAHPCSGAFTVLPQCCGVKPDLLAKPVPCALCARGTSVVSRFNKLETAAACVATLC